MDRVDVLIPSFNRRAGLAVTLTGLLGQSFTAFDVTISDQSDDPGDVLESVEVQTLIGALRYRGHRVTTHHHLPRRGLAEQRYFLLEQASAPLVHFIDDDVALEPFVMANMAAAMRRERCGFVGAAAVGVGYLDDVRPHQQAIELWDGPVTPEPFAPGAIPTERHLVNNAANALHLEQALVRGGVPVLYKVAWVGGANVLYDRAKLLEVGGFGFWDRLPPAHAGEEVVVQFLLIRRYGGCGILPSGTYHLMLPTSVPDRTHNATDLFGDLIAEGFG